MKSIRRALLRILASLGGNQAADDDLRAEMEAHLEMETQENIRRGMRPDEGRRRAVLASGGLTQAAEHVRRARGLPSIESIVADLRYAVRHFRRTPLSTITIVLVLSLGIGAAVVLFTVLSSLATMPAPGMTRDPSLVRIRGTTSMNVVAGVQPRLLSWPEVQEYAGRTDLFTGVTAHADETATISAVDAATPASVHVIYTTPNYFSILDVRPALGTQPHASESLTSMTTAPSAMVSHAMWQQWFGGATDVIGRTLRVNDVPVRIVGVAPPRFSGTRARGAMTIWMPLAAYPLLQKRSGNVFASRDSAFLAVAARLRPGLGPEDATPIVAAIARRGLPPPDGRWPGQGASENRAQSGVGSGSAEVVPLLATNDRAGSGGRTDMLVSVATAGSFTLLVLLITCTNVSALLVGLAVARRREVGVRLSLGAPRGRLVRQFLTESILLALVAAMTGLIATTAGIHVMAAMLQDIQLVVDWRVAFATCAVALATGLLFGLSPALHATRVPVSEVLSGASATVGAARSRLQRGLVVAQIALTQPLLVGLGVVVVTMATDSSARVTSAVAGQVLEIELDTWSGTSSPADGASWITAAVERVAAMPGVLAAMPLQMGTVVAPLTVHPADRIAGAGHGRAMAARLVAAPRGYFSALEIPIVRGRDFDSGEYAAGANADGTRAPTFDRAIIGTDLARRLWGDTDPVGRRLNMAVPGSGAPSLIVVGVVNDAAAGPSDANGQVRVYVPYSAMNSGVMARTAGPALPHLNAIRRAVAAEAPHLPIIRAQTIEQREAEAHRAVLQTSGAVAAGGVLALLLSAIGLYAVVSFSVGQRTREIGVRTALGAQRGRVIRMFFGNGLLLCALGLVLGLPLSMLATRLIASALSWPLASSPLIGVAIGTVVLAVASVAVWLPAHRASTIDPVIALRTD